jgi:lipopolysaccharide/colanic/teichoic acid biosynthesis glycosyltransferase
MKENSEKKGPVWAEKQDARITRIGKFLRKTHLDEIPQMLNILKGDISLVGPRPERPEFIEKLEKEIPFYHIRHLIKPGFTGWAQIKFRYSRSVIDSKEKFQYDLYYIKNNSLFLDIGILLKTFQLFFKKE